MNLFFYFLYCIVISAFTFPSQTTITLVTHAGVLVQLRPQKQLLHGR